MIITHRGRKMSALCNPRLTSDEIGTHREKKEASLKVQLGTFHFLFLFSGLC